MIRQPLNAEEAALVASIKERTKDRHEIDVALLRFRAAKFAKQGRAREALLSQVTDAVIGKKPPLTGRALAMWRALHGV